MQKFLLFSAFPGFTLVCFRFHVLIWLLLQLFSFFMLSLLLFLFHFRIVWSVHINLIHHQYGRSWYTRLRTYVWYFIPYSFSLKKIEWLQSQRWIEICLLWWGKSQCKKSDKKTINDGFKKIVLCNGLFYAWVYECGCFLSFRWTFFMLLLSAFKQQQRTRRWMHYQIIAMEWLLLYTLERKIVRKQWITRRRSSYTYT